MVCPAEAASKYLLSPSLHSWDTKTVLASRWLQQRMNTPELWRPSHIVPWTCTGRPIRKSENHFFQSGDLDLWPITLTFELLRDIIKVNLPTNFRVHRSKHSVMRALNNRHTGPILYPRPLTQEGTRDVSKIVTLGPAWFCFKYIHELHVAY